MARGGARQLGNRPVGRGGLQRAQAAVVQRSAAPGQKKIIKKVIKQQVPVGKTLGQRAKKIVIPGKVNN